MKRRLAKSEMIGFIVLFAVILTITAGWLFKENFSSPSSPKNISEAEIEEIKKFNEGIKEDSIKFSKRKYHKDFSKHKITPFPFNPNQADSSTLAQLGLHSWQITNLLRYRKKGGRWKSAEDFQRLYGLSEEDFKQLKPFIRIDESEASKGNTHFTTDKDSVFRNYPKKFPEGTVLQLNEADTTALKGIPGIGSYYARKICKYRERLGGFLSIQQLKEIEGLPENIEKWFTISSPAVIKKININTTDFKGLVRHPYLNYEQTKAICNYISKYGKIHSWEELSNNENFTADDIKRLAPYISFE